MKKILTLIAFAAIIFIVVALPRMCNPYDERTQRTELERIQQERDSLIKCILQRIKQQWELIQDTTIIREELRYLRTQNEDQKARLSTLIERERKYESRLNYILTLSDAVMDSLYRTRYPPDSLRR